MKKSSKTITVKVEISVSKPPKEVFEAVLKPAPYFIKKASSPMKAGSEVMWEFPEFPGTFPIKVRKVEPHKLIRFEWARGETKDTNTVEFRFKPHGKNATTVYVSESGWPDTGRWRETSYRNTMGWMNMITSLKGWLEHGVNLREGAFTHMKFD